MKRYLSIFLFLSCTLLMQAQNIVVQSFRLDESDLTANTAGTIVIDQNGQKCALIKVETSETGFAFDTGIQGVSKIEQHVGEIWVYVPEGVKRITISHQQLGVLRDYDLGQTLKRAKTYIMKLTTGEVQTIRLRAPTPILGEADINSSPAMADIYIDGKKVGQTPQLAEQLLIGQHQVRISKQGYQDYSAILNVKENEPTILSATLEKPKAEQTIVKSPSTTSDESRKVITVGNVSFTMIHVEGGTFTMGATSGQGSDAYNHEKPTHQVRLSPYYIGETEVTQALWETVMGSNPSNYKGANRPVETVSWNDCQDFVRKLNQKTGQSFHLPTEAEWEYAARGGNKSRGYKYSGSKKLNDVAWYTKTTKDTGTRDVKTKQANELGLYDMSGNVWEWCLDWYGEYSSNSQTNPTGPSSGSFRVLRGGSWDINAWYCRVSLRNYGAPEIRGGSLGLRLALQ